MTSSNLEEKDLVDRWRLVEQKIDRVQNFLDNNYRLLEEELAKQKKNFNALETMFYVILGLSILQLIFLFLK